MHKKIVAFVVLKSDGVGNTRRHRHGGYACRTDERIDFAFREDVEQFADKQAADCGKHESCKTEEHDFERGQGEEGRADCGCADGNAEEQRDDVHKRVLRGVAETFGYAAFTQEVAEHKASEQRRNGRQKQGHDDCDENRENDFLFLADLAGGLHNGHTLFLCCEQLHKRRLQERNESHIRVCRNCDRRKQFGCERLCKEDSRRAVRACDNRNGCRLSAGESHCRRENKHEVDTALRRRAENERTRARKHRSEVGHCAHADENEAGINARLYAYIEHIEQAAVLQNVEIIYAVCHSRVARPPFRMKDFVAVECGQVGEKHTERDAHEKQRFKLLFDAEIEEKQRDYNHHDGLPTAFLTEKMVAAAVPDILQDFAYIHTKPLSSIRKAVSRC